MVRIPERLQGLLREVMGRYCPGMLPGLSANGELSIDSEQREPLRNSLAGELCATGLTANDEPNDRGYALEELIDLVGKA